MMTHKRTVAIDFDGVIHAHRAPWTYPNEINDGPVPGAFEFIESVLTEFNVVIYSARADSWHAREAICAWLQTHWPAVRVIARKGEGVHVGDAWIRVTHEKPHAFIYIDDRGWRFEGTFPTMDELRAFETWTKRSAPIVDPEIQVPDEMIVTATEGCDLLVNGVLVKLPAKVHVEDVFDMKKRNTSG